MKQEDLNQLLEKYRSGLMTDKEVINVICTFVARNYPVFGLHKYDEDFRQDIILHLLERGTHLIQLFNPDFGDFFTFLYCYISTLINATLKKKVIISMKERLNIEESMYTLNEKEFNYNRIDFTNFEEKKAPFAPQSIPQEELQKALRELSLKHQDKKVIILALKSSYYLTDEQIERICNLYGIKREHFYSMVQHCKDSLDNKHQRREKALERRNFAYYHHKRYNRIIQDIKDKDLPDYNNMMRDQLSNKEKKHHHNWMRLNEAFEKGHLYLRPTTKTVANIMGMCERQVNYYLRCAKKEIEKAEAKKKSEA